MYEDEKITTNLVPITAQIESLVSTNSEKKQDDRISIDHTNNRRPIDDESIKNLELLNDKNDQQNKNKIYSFISRKSINDFFTRSVLKKTSGDNRSEIKHMPKETSADKSENANNKKPFSGLGMLSFLKSGNFKTNHCWRQDARDNENEVDETKVEAWDGKFSLREWFSQKAETTKKGWQNYRANVKENWAYRNRFPEYTGKDLVPYKAISGATKIVGFLEKEKHEKDADKTVSTDNLFKLSDMLKSDQTDDVEEAKACFVKAARNGSLWNLVEGLERIAFEVGVDSLGRHRRRWYGESTQRAKDLAARTLNLSLGYVTRKDHDSPTGRHVPITLRGLLDVRTFDNTKVELLEPMLDEMLDSAREIFRLLAEEFHSLKGFDTDKELPKTPPPPPPKDRKYRKNFEDINTAVYENHADFDNIPASVETVDKDALKSFHFNLNELNIKKKKVEEYEMDEYEKAAIDDAENMTVPFNNNDGVTVSDNDPLKSNDENNVEDDSR